MTHIYKLKAVAGLFAVLALGACGNMNTNPTANTYPQSSNVYSQYGVVQSIELVRQDVAHNNIGAGTIAGAVVGGILGHQVGGGSGNTAATVLGAAGGAYVGNRLEKNNQGTQSVDAYKISIRMNNGTYQTITQTSDADIRVGDRVQIDNGVARRY